MQKATGRYRIYSSLVKLQPRFHEFTMEDLPLGRIAALVPEFAVKDLPLGRTLMMMMMMIRTDDYLCYKEPKCPYNFFILIFKELFTFKTSVDPGGPVVIILASGSEVRGYDPGRGRWIFSERKNPEYDFPRKGSKAVGPVS